MLVDRVCIVPGLRAEMVRLLEIREEILFSVVAWVASVEGVARSPSGRGAASSVFSSSTGAGDAAVDAVCPGLCLPRRPPVREN